MFQEGLLSLASFQNQLCFISGPTIATSEYAQLWATNLKARCRTGSGSGEPLRVFISKCAPTIVAEAASVQVPELYISRSRMVFSRTSRNGTVDLKHVARAKFRFILNLETAVHAFASGPSFRRTPALRGWTTRRALLQPARKFDLDGRTAA
jgi:hypothetical protein